MFEWEGRILDNKSIMVVKAALPYLDIPVGDIIDLEGLLRAVRKFCIQKEQKVIDMILNFFMMKRMMSMMNMMNQMNQMNEAENAGQNMDGMLELLKSQMPKEQQEMFDMVSMMMSAMAPGNAETDGEEQADDRSGGDFQEYASGESPDYPRDGEEGKWEGYEEHGASGYGGDAATESSQPFVFPGGGYNPFGNFDERHERGTEAESRDDETGREE